ncbi:MAG TPA: hypothetical protein VFG14_14960, partial [Chthoniobacteraceae bacterium]|nr:hypothetical protein [Chthoniobacteraceae bacterium]
VMRQAPPGTFSTISPQDKRLVEVPLAEIFKRVSPAILKRRDDQRYNDLALDGFDIFGDDENPYSLTPRVEDSAVSAPEPVPTPAPTPAVPPPRVLQVPPGMVSAPPPSVTPPGRVVAPPTQPLAAKPRVAVPPTPFVPPSAPPPPAAPSKPLPPIDDGQPPLVLPLKDLLSGWPEPIKSEASALNGTTVSLPSGQVGVGLARGKVAFNWGQIRAWMNPPPETPTEASDSIELLLPLRVIAPAFLKHSKGPSARKGPAVVEDIPELFAGRNAPPPPPPSTSVDQAAVSEPSLEPALAPTPEAESEPTPVPVPETPEARIESPPESEVSSEPAPSEVIREESSADVPAPVLQPQSEPADGEKTPAAEIAASEPVPEPAAESTADSAPPLAPLPKAAIGLEPQSLAEAFNQPGKQSWSPSEIVNCLAGLPQIAGSVVALQEGLVIAHRLPEPLKGEVFAAFLPQIFARINQYSNEMKLGTVDDLLINAHGLPCHLFRIGQVYFAALGNKPGEPLPTSVLRLCAAALAS